jgi:hypothetical protein
MDFLKKHYEKLILGLVLVGLAVAVAALPFKITGDRQALEEKRNTLTRPKVQPLTNTDLTVSEAALKRTAARTESDFAPPNKLFNPMPWQKAADGQLIPATKVGPMAAAVTNITPLYLRITLDSVIPSDAGARYVIGVQKEAATVVSQRNKKQTYASLNSKNETFTVVEVKGPAEDPKELVLELNDSGERAVVSKEKPFQRIDGYTADLRYDPERKSWSARRVGMTVSFAGEDYNIVAINQNEVVLSAKSNQKKWTIKQTTSTGS